MTPRSNREIGRWEQWFDRFMLALGWTDRAAAGRRRTRGLLSILLLVERTTERRHALRPVRPGGVVRYEVARLRSRPLPLPSQPAVRRGERIIVLHFDNRAVVAMEAAVPDTHALTWRLARTARRDLYALAERARRGEFPPDVRAAWAESLFSASLARYGFATRPVRRTLRTPFARIFLLGMVAIYGRAGSDGLGKSRHLRLPLSEAWISLDDLQRRFSKVGSRE